MWNMLIGSGGSIIAAGVIFLFSYWYNRKRQSDAEANEYTRLINEITNLNTKIANASEATKNDYTYLRNEMNNLRNEMNNLNTKFENGFERFFLEIDKLRSTAKTNTEKIDALTSNVDTNTQKIDTNTQKIDAINIILNKNLTTTDEIMKTIIELQNIVGNFIKLPRSQ